MFEQFHVIPAVDIKDGETVQLVGGEQGTGTQYGSPVTAARQWAQAGAPMLHVIDLDGAFDGDRANAETIAEIVAQTEIPIQVGGGIRTAADAFTLLDAGVDRVILGTAALQRPDLVAEIAAQYPEGVLVSLDAKDDEIVVEGWTESTGLDPVEAATRYVDLGAAGFLFTDVNTEGRLGGIRADRVKRLVEAVSLPVIASGGVASIEDLLTLREIGAASAVVGSALYEGVFTLDRAQQALNQ